MKDTLHRSENLWIWSEEGSPVIVELRFSNSISLGSSDRGCPRCGELGDASHWELDGPDGPSNTIWFGCKRGNGCPGHTESERFIWMRNVVFADWKEN